MAKTFYANIAFVAIGTLYLLFGPRQLFFQLCHQMKLHHIVTAPETLYIESVADNFYKAIFFQLNTYKLINHCQPSNLNWRLPFDFLGSAVWTLIKGCSDLDSAFIKDIGNKHKTDLHVAFQQKLFNGLITTNSMYFYTFFIALFFHNYIQTAVVNAYSYILNLFFNGGNIAEVNDNRNNDGGPGSSDGPGGNDSGNQGGNNNGSSTSQRRCKTEHTTRRKHLPTGKKLSTRQEASSPSAPLFSNAPSSSNAPNIDIDNTNTGQSQTAYKESSDRFKKSFTQVNHEKGKLQETLSRYQGLVNGLKRDYKETPEIPLSNFESSTITVQQVLAAQEELANKVRHISTTKGKNRDTLDALVNSLRIAKKDTDVLEQQIHDYNFATRDPFVLLTKETLAQMPSPHKRPANIPSTSHPPTQFTTSESSSSDGDVLSAAVPSPSPAPASSSSSFGQQTTHLPRVKNDPPMSQPGPSERAAPTKRHFSADEEMFEVLRNMPRYDSTFEDIPSDHPDIPFKVNPLKEYDNYRFPPGAYDPPSLNPEIPPTPAEIDYSTCLLATSNSRARDSGSSS
ncbi:hypothetical protein PS15p_206864 [Mucor circinelloides]